MQVAVVAWCRAQAHVMPEVAEVYHVPNYRHIPGTGRQRAAAVERLRAAGLVDGMSDLAWDYARPDVTGTLKYGFRIELKAPTGTVTRAQDERRRLLLRRGYYAAVCVGQDATEWLARAYWHGDAPVLQAADEPVFYVPGRESRPHQLVKTGTFFGVPIMECMACGVFGRHSDMNIFKCCSERGVEK